MRPDLAVIALIKPPWAVPPCPGGGPCLLARQADRRALLTREAGTPYNPGGQSHTALSFYISLSPSLGQLK